MINWKNTIRNIEKTDEGQVLIKIISGIFTTIPYIITCIIFIWYTYSYFKDKFLFIFITIIISLILGFCNILFNLDDINKDRTKGWKFTDCLFSFCCTPLLLPLLLIYLLVNYILKLKTIILKCIDIKPPVKKIEDKQYVNIFENENNSKPKEPYMWS